MPDVTVVASTPHFTAEAVDAAPSSHTPLERLTAVDSWDATKTVYRKDSLQAHTQTHPVSSLSESSEGTVQNGRSSHQAWDQ